ncbi:MAG: 4Fe-4S dicluster domain-containing protein [Candidatus Micrarchaeota archaeon]
MAKISIDEQKCTGCGLCANTCPLGTFKIENNISQVNEETASRCLLCKACEVGCPTGAIKVEE